MSRKNAIVAVEATVNRIVFTVDGVGSIDMLLGNLSADVANRAMVHGLIQKVSDAAALGKDATPSDKHAAMLATVERLTGPDGSWNKRTGEASDSAPSGLIFRAFSEFAGTRALDAGRTPPTEEALRKLYDSKSRAEQLAYRKVPEIAAIIERIKAEKPSKSTVDASAMFDELDELDG